jgi:hypothetical protein
MNEEEEWRTVANYDNLYLVSNFGRIKSLNRNKGRILKQQTSPTGYMQVWLGSPRKIFLVHRLVAVAFLGLPVDPKFVVCHNDGDRENNSASNLRWDSTQNNCLDRNKHGTMERGSAHRWSKLTESNVHDIRRRLAGGESKSAIAKDFNVSRQLIFLIYKGRSWSWLEKEKSDG